MTDDDDILRYDRMVESALRGVVRRAVEEVVDYGRKNGVDQNRMPGDHHFYITFLTDYPGVKIPDYLRDRYPGEMTIVLQYQFSDLSVDKDNLKVTLSFNNLPERLVVPLSAISIFADPSVNFALQFQPMGEDTDDGAFDLESDDEPDDTGGGGGKKKGDAKTGEVVSLDKFRKK